MNQHEWLFEGVFISGYLSNELSLARDCPAEFKDPDNPWHIFIDDILSGNGNFKGWAWRTIAAAELDRKSRHFVNYLLTDDTRLRHHERRAVLAWMISELLTDVPG